MSLTSYRAAPPRDPQALLIMAAVRVCARSFLLFSGVESERRASGRRGGAEKARGDWRAPRRIAPTGCHRLSRQRPGLRRSSAAFGLGERGPRGRRDQARFDCQYLNCVRLSGPPLAQSVLGCASPIPLFSITSLVCSSAFLRPRHPRRAGALRSCARPPSQSWSSALLLQDSLAQSWGFLFRAVSRNTGARPPAGCPPSARVPFPVHRHCQHRRRA